MLYLLYYDNYVFHITSPVIQYFAKLDGYVKLDTEYARRMLQSAIKMTKIQRNLLADVSAIRCVICDDTQSVCFLGILVSIHVSVVAELCG